MTRKSYRYASTSRTGEVAPPDRTPLRQACIRLALPFHCACFMAKKRNDLVDRTLYIGFRLLTMVLLAVPLQANLRVAEFLGSLLFKFDRKHRERCITNLRRSMPELSNKQVLEMGEHSMQQIFKLFVEVLFTDRKIKLETMGRYIAFGDLTQVIRLLMRRDRGLILVTGHFGNFEVLGYVMAVLGFESSTVARPLDNKYVNDWLMGVREKMGQRIIDKRGAVQEVQDTLENKGTVGFTADQDAGKRGMFVDFFGRQASAYKSIGLMAMRYEVPIVIGYARRLNNGFEFAGNVQDVIQPEDWADEPDPLRYLTQRYTRAIENFTREAPGQYWWVHRRWKTRPPGETPLAFD